MKNNSARTCALGIRGAVAPYAWGVFHNVTGIAILADDGETYVVKANGPGRVLFRHIDARVTVGGEVWIEGGARFIRVEAIRFENNHFALL